MDTFISGGAKDLQTSWASSETTAAWVIWKSAGALHEF